MSSAGTCHQAVSDRYHLLACLLAASAAAAGFLQGSATGPPRERIVGATVIALCHAIARRVLPLERHIREHLRELGAGPSADLEIRRFDRMHRVYVSLEIAAIVIGLAVLTSAVLAR